MPLRHCGSPCGGVRLLWKRALGQQLADPAVADRRRRAPGFSGAAAVVAYVVKSGKVPVFGRLAEVPLTISEGPLQLIFGVVVRLAVFGGLGGCSSKVPACGDDRRTAPIAATRRPYGHASRSPPRR